MENSSSAPTCEKPKLKPKVEQMPPYRIILHNDEINTAEYVVTKVQEITKLEEEIAVKRVIEAHENGLAPLLTTHKEKAELFVEMFESCKITVTMEKIT